MKRKIQEERFADGAYIGCVLEPSLVMTPSLSISICLKVLTFCRISSSVYLREDIKEHIIYKTHIHILLQSEK